MYLNVFLFYKIVKLIRFWNRLLSAKIFITKQRKKIEKKKQSISFL